MSQDQDHHRANSVPSKHNILVFGSCVTRDALQYAQSELDVLWYQARTCIASMMSPPLEVKVDYESSAMSNFEKRNVEFDLNKKWREQLDIPADAILFDFIDERFGLALTEASAYTYSTAFQGIMIKDGPKPFTRFLPPTSEAYYETLLRHIPAFCEVLSTRSNIIINDVFWTKHIEDGGVLLPKMIEMSAGCNRVLDSIYNELAKRTKAMFLAIPEADLIARYGHRWGDAPFHYSEHTEKLIADRIIEGIQSLNRADNES